MSFKTCPIARVDAPVDSAWELLYNPESFDLWWNAETLSIEPPGPARSGQVFQATTVGLGKRWPVNATVNKVDAVRRQIDLTTRLPLGITINNHIICSLVDATSCQVSFG